ncbi:hypothetical protein GWI33_004620 [Rhynchophorus ferrugineus]|uniref:Uncharacterized protein n=1 Tax=Rhynchophorus ferrugineus TaxID=354439 RepID=A0A834IUD4_RHYFE|nr:hypothetical protein GWI33_004620 [Rhynchophorus ferrugineus]
MHRHQKFVDSQYSEPPHPKPIRMRLQWPSNRTNEKRVEKQSEFNILKQMSVYPNVHPETYVQGGIQNGRAVHNTVRDVAKVVGAGSDQWRRCILAMSFL